VAIALASPPLAGSGVAHRHPSLGEVVVENAEGDVAEQGREYPPCGVPVIVSRSMPSSLRIPALRNAFTRPTTQRAVLHRYGFVPRLSHAAGGSLWRASMPRRRS
jgi:hypothetical protein